MSKRNGRVSLESLGAKTVAATIYSPEGEEIVVQIRALKSHELRTLTAGMGPEPEAPVGDYERNTAGEVEAVPDLKDPQYLLAMADYGSRRGYLLLINSLENVEIPGDTEDEQVASLQGMLALWAEQQILDVVNRINGFGQRELREAQASLTPFADGS